MTAYNALDVRHEVPDRLDVKFLLSKGTMCFLAARHSLGDGLGELVVVLVMCQVVNLSGYDPAGHDANQRLISHRCASEAILQGRYAGVTASQTIAITNLWRKIGLQYILHEARNSS